MIYVKVNLLALEEDLRINGFESVCINELFSILQL